MGTKLRPAHLVLKDLVEEHVRFFLDAVVHPRHPSLPLIVHRAEATMLCIALRQMIIPHRARFGIANKLGLLGELVRDSDPGSSLLREMLIETAREIRNRKPAGTS